MVVLLKFIAKAAFIELLPCAISIIWHLSTKTANPSLVTVHKLVLGNGIISQSSRTMFPFCWKLYLSRYLMSFFY